VNDWRVYPRCERFFLLWSTVYGLLPDELRSAFKLILGGENPEEWSQNDDC
jgi:hypothetical protein